MHQLGKIGPVAPLQYLISMAWTASTRTTGQTLGRFGARTEMIRGIRRRRLGKSVRKTRRGRIMSIRIVLRRLITPQMPMHTSRLRLAIGRMRHWPELGVHLRHSLTQREYAARSRVVAGLGLFNLCFVLVLIFPTYVIVITSHSKYTHYLFSSKHCLQTLKTSTLSFKS
jgi:hypothetical protein